MSDTRTIFNDQYFILQAIILSKKFQSKEKKLHKLFASLGIPIPEKGFPTAKKYYKWVNKLSGYGYDSNEMLNNLLEEFGIEPENQELYRVGLIWKVFLKKQKTPIFPVLQCVKAHKFKNKITLVLELYPYVTKDDWLGMWTYVKRYFSVTKNKEMSSFAKKLEVYELFLKVKQDLAKGIIKNTIDNSHSPYANIAYYPEFLDIEKKYGSKDLEGELRSIISWCNKKIGKLNLL